MWYTDDDTTYDSWAWYSEPTAVGFSDSDETLRDSLERALTATSGFGASQSGGSDNLWLGMALGAAICWIAVQHVPFLRKYALGTARG